MRTIRVPNTTTMPDAAAVWSQNCSSTGNSPTQARRTPMRMMPPSSCRTRRRAGAVSAVDSRVLVEYPARVVTTTPATISVTLNASPGDVGAHAEGTEVFLPPLRVLRGEHARQYPRDEEDGEERGEPVGVHGDRRQVRDVGADGSGDPDEDCRCHGVQDCAHERPLEDREQRQPAEQEDAGMCQRECGDVDDSACSAARGGLCRSRPPALQGTDHHRCGTEDRASRAQQCRPPNPVRTRQQVPARPAGTPRRRGGESRRCR